MSQQPFTPSGVQQKQAELNQLSVADRLTQANLIRSDFRTWMSDNFSLTADQQTYLTNMDDRFIQIAASLIGFAVENMLSIILSINGGGGGGLKLVHLSTDMDVVYSTQSFSSTGNVYINIDYQSQ